VSSARCSDPCKLSSGIAYHPPILVFLHDPAVDISVSDSERTPIIQESKLEAGHAQVNDKRNASEKLKFISGAIADGAQAFLKTEYIYISVFCVIFALVIGLVLPNNGWATSFSFLWGAATSVSRSSSIRPSKRLQL
jgi:hypothetical protein